MARDAQSLFALLLLPALAAPAVGCASTPARGPAVQAAAPGPLFCWELSQPGGATSYLLGSIHALPQNRADIDVALGAAFARADTLVVELDTIGVDQDAVAQQAMAVGVYPQDEPGLDGRLSPALWQRTAAALDQSGAPSFLAKRFRPWLAALTITLGDMQRAGFKPEMGVDHQLLTRAHAAKKPIVELETIDQQLELFAGLDEPTQIKMLQEALVAHDDADGALMRLLDAWAAGDPDALAKEIEAPLAKDPSAAPYYERWLYARNRTMAASIDALARDGRSHFVVVGAAHLVGARGLLQLMRDRGWSLRQLSSAAFAPTSRSPAPAAHK